MTSQSCSHPCLSPFTQKLPDRASYLALKAACYEFLHRYLLEQDGITEEANECDHQGITRSHALFVGAPNVPTLNLKEGEKLESNEDWKVLLSNEALHYQDSLQDELSHPTAKVKLQVSSWLSEGSLQILQGMDARSYSRSNILLLSEDAVGPQHSMQILFTPKSSL